MTNEGAVVLLCNDLQKPVAKLIRAAKKSKLNFRLLVESEESFSFVADVKGKPVESDEMKSFVKSTLENSGVEVKGCRVSIKANEVVSKTPEPLFSLANEVDVPTEAEEIPVEKPKKKKSENN